MTGTRDEKFNGSFGTTFRARVVILGLVGVFLFTAATTVAQLRLGVPAYQDPGSAQWTAWAAPGSKSIGVMIVNLDNGDDEHYYASVDRAIRATRKQGIFVLGYTYTGYGTRDPKIVRRKINAVYRNYLVDGMFFDEAPTDCNASNSFFPNAFLYYQALTNSVREKVGARITVLNPGTYSASDCWMGITNILMNWEDQGLDSYKKNYVDFAWVHKYSPDRFWHIVYGMSADQLPEALELAKQRNAGWVYLTEEIGNPYAGPPQYWGAESRAVKDQAVQAPFATTWPKSLDAQWNPARGRTSIRWTGSTAASWQIFLDTDQNSKTGYTGGGVAVGAEYLFENDGGTAHLLRYTGTGADWKWKEIPANADLASLDASVQTATFDTASLGETKALNFQIRASDGSGNLIYDSYVSPLSLNNTDMVFDITNHKQ